ncbi:NAD-dependent epimerase/dehydratase family protein [Kineosporia sp. J2-2]|uniref:NAD-dependent epimerase/dehydratase family protein n=1 Tax=Kineosporia corallincola TaxID=2835133 RepID=A0ABS5TFM6_9ACTN|nr:NAD-dependent epimerase/dehydratase family protein [Kineosporia corallincola]MBT0769895.1 NAD-dependent epimerase/dehydratase family protein [Kineosporia corallincola]
MSGELVLVTGGSGFVGSHCVLRLLQEGYRVRTTVRSLRREADVRAMTGEDGDALSFAVADLTAEAGWEPAMDGCDYVLHVASPVPQARPRDEAEVIEPAREGTLRVLRAARAAGVRRTVLTSSFAAVKYGHGDRTTFTEADWSDPDAPQMAAYSKSKLAAERAAWEFTAGGGTELAVVNPPAVFGPALGADLSLWAGMVDSLLKGTLPALPRITVAVVDVRDVADLHVRAMVDPAAAGERFLAGAGALTLAQIAALLRENLGDAAGRVPSRTLPDWAVRLAARVNPRAALVVSELGVAREPSGRKARELLGWNPRPVEESVLDLARSLQARSLPA